MSPVAEQEEQEVPTCVPGQCPGEGMGAGAGLFLFICKGTPASCRWQNRHRFLHLCCNTEKEGLLELVKTIYIYLFTFFLSLSISMQVLLGGFQSGFYRHCAGLPKQLPLVIPILHEP